LRTSFSEIKKIFEKSINDAQFRSYTIDLIPTKSLIVLNIPWGEMHCYCSKDEYKEFVQNLKLNNLEIKRNKWFQFWDRH